MPPPAAGEKNPQSPNGKSPVGANGVLPTTPATRSPSVLPRALRPVGELTALAKVNRYLMCTQTHTQSPNKRDVSTIDTIDTRHYQQFTHITGEIWEGGGKCAREHTKQKRPEGVVQGGDAGLPPALCVLLLGSARDERRGPGSTGLAGGGRLLRLAAGGSLDGASGLLVRIPKLAHLADAARAGGGGCHGLLGLLSLHLRHTTTRTRVG